MGFEELLPKKEEENLNEEKGLNEKQGFSEDKTDKIGQNQVYDLITGFQPDWQSLIYELINSEQLDPWDIDIVVLTNKYFERIISMEEEAIEEGIDFYISSKVLLAASLLLRIKSEFLLNKHLSSIDEILFGKKDNKNIVMEKIEIDEDEVPILIPKTPLPRQRKVTLDELMNALNHAINTETRRIKKEIAVKRAKKLSEVDFPKFKRIDLKDRIKQFYANILTNLKKINKPLKKVGFLELIGESRDEKLASFLPLLHLSNNKKIWVNQEEHLGEIWIYLYKDFLRNKEKFLETLEEEEVDNEFESLSKDISAVS